MRTIQDIYPLIKSHQQLLDEGYSRNRISHTTKSGELLRLRKGIYIHRKDAQTLTRWERYWAEILALNGSTKNTVFSHHSAAALHGLPLLSVPSKIHIYCKYDSRGYWPNICRHPRLTEDTPLVNTDLGAQTTELALTLLDCARWMPFRDAVAVADSALFQRKISLEEAQGTLLSFGGRGKRRIHELALALSVLSESPGETLLRLLLDEMGIEYVQQYPVNLAGHEYRADFYLPAYGVFIEFDGQIKYTEFGSTQQVLVQERQREKQFLNTGERIFRVGWQDVYATPGLFKSRLKQFLDQGAGRADGGIREVADWRRPA